jgi:hypothetical protein
MQNFEYKVVPAPVRGERERGVKTVAERFGVALSNLMNSMAAEGWDYLRADTLPCEERVGFTGRATAFQNMLVFRRSLAGGASQPVTAPVMVPVEVPLPRVGAAEQAPGMAPALGPARPELAAE